MSPQDEQDFIGLEHNHRVMAGWLRHAGWALLIASVANLAAIIRGILADSLWTALNIAVAVLLINAYDQFLKVRNQTSIHVSYLRDRRVER